MTARSGPGRALAPTAAQRLLLRAALLDGPEGREAWEVWRRETDIERLDPGSQRLLPLLYRTARSYAADDPLLDRLKGVYRHTWSANGLLLLDAGRVLRALVRAGVHVVALDGTALVVRYYQDRGARAADSIAVLVSPDDVPMAAGVLAEEGWRSDPPDLPGAGPYTSQARLVGGHRAVDLLWDPFPEGCGPGIGDEFRASSEPGEVAEVACRLLSPTDELLRTCVRAARWEEIPSFRRLADAQVILRTAGARVDWDRLADHAVRVGVVLPVLAALSLVREVLDAPVPADTLRRLQHARVSAGDRLEQRLREAPRPHLGRLPDLLFRYRRLAGPGPAGSRQPGLVRYLQGAWGVRRGWQLPFVALAKGVRRLLRAAGTPAVW